MIVRESIEFQRGLDPKKSIGLGIGQLDKFRLSSKSYPNLKRSHWKEVSEAFGLPYKQLYYLCDDDLNSKNPLLDELYDLTQRSGKLIYKRDWHYKESPHKDEMVVFFNLYETNIGLIGELHFRYEQGSHEYIGDLHAALKLDLNHRNLEHLDLITEAINFERGLSPKTSMSIGLMEKIRGFMDEFGNNTEEHWFSDLIQKNLSPNWSDSLDDETRIAWINYLLKIPGEWLKNLDENDYVQMKEEGIEWIPYIPIPGNDFSYRRLGFGDNYVLKFNGWEEFSGYFDTGRDLSEEFIENVLSGDAHDDFYYDSDAYDITDLAWHIQRIINKGEEVPAIKDLKEKAIELGGNPENMETIDDLLQEINDNDDLHDLRQAVLFAFLDAQESADESAAYRSLVNAIQKWYDIGEGKWEGEGDTAIMIVPITKKGLLKFFYSLMTGDDKIKYYPPDQGYSGDITKDDINDAIYNKIEDL